MDKPFKLCHCQHRKKKKEKMVAHFRWCLHSSSWISEKRTTTQKRSVFLKRFLWDLNPGLLTWESWALTMGPWSYLPNGAADKFTWPPAPFTWQSDWHWHTSIIFSVVFISERGVSLSLTAATCYPHAARNLHSKFHLNRFSTESWHSVDTETQAKTLPYL